MHRKKCVLWIFVFLLLLNIVYAPPPFQESSIEQGINIEATLYDVYPVATNFSMNFHVFNASNGVLLTENVNCSVHIYNFVNGSHIVEMDALLVGDDFEFLIHESYLPIPGIYYLMITCQNGVIGGFFSFPFHVGYNDLLPTIPDAIINSLFILIAVIFFIVSLSFAFVLDGDDLFTMGAEGEHILEFNALKYVKLFLYLLSYFFFWITTWVIWITFEKFMLSSYSTDLLRILFIVETIMWVPMIFMIVFIGLVKYIADAKALKLAKRRLMPR